MDPTETNSVLFLVYSVSNVLRLEEHISWALRDQPLFSNCILYLPNSYETLSTCVSLNRRRNHILHTHIVTMAQSSPKMVYEQKRRLWSINRKKIWERNIHVQVFVYMYVYVLYHDWLWNPFIKSYKWTPIYCTNQVYLRRIRFTHLLPDSRVIRCCLDTRSYPSMSDVETDKSRE